MPYSVIVDDAVYDVVVARKTESIFIKATLVPSYYTNRLPIRLCRLIKPVGSEGWTVLVDGDTVQGPRLVEGFATRNSALQYAVLIRPEINANWKAVQTHLFD